MSELVFTELSVCLYVCSFVPIIMMMMIIICRPWTEWKQQHVPSTLFSCTSVRRPQLAQGLHLWRADQGMPFPAPLCCTSRKLPKHQLGDWLVGCPCAQQIAVIFFLTQSTRWLVTIPLDIGHSLSSDIKHMPSSWV